ncbi:MAG: glycosyl hydrolase 53 family protein [Paludibacteraceae bacterium]|nr:glycosyl hydrolase 53 family protein [Paludibacteraceae bacterium]
MKMKKIFTFLFICMFFFMSSSLRSQPFAYGADVSWVTEMEEAGKKFFSSDGSEMECMTLLKSLGINSIRLRVWVNPPDGWCNAQDVLTKAIRANNLGLRLMIDFHYSDTWADPGKQTKPVAWSSLSFEDLKTALANHTIEVLTLLKDNDITPEWVQIGNETGDGMLWEDGRASKNMKNYAELTTTGYNAVKSVFPTTKVIVHLQNGYDNNLYQWIFDGLKNNGGKWDVIGMSVYPYWYKTKNDWQNCNIDCLNNMNDLVNRYGKEIMAVECGMDWYQPEICKNFLSDLITKTKSVSNGKGLGVFYWEPECYNNWNGYTMGAFDNSGRPTVALDAFKEAAASVISPKNKPKWIFKPNTHTLLFENKQERISIFQMNGRLVNSFFATNTISLNDLQNGIYIVKAVSYKNEKPEIFKLVK